MHVNIQLSSLLESSINFPMSGRGGGRMRDGSGMEVVSDMSSASGVRDGSRSALAAAVQIVIGHCMTYYKNIMVYIYIHL